ncbi:MAG: hypothetical protein Q4E07_05725, partial [Eubacteriales bacterium]|nr:hypothetical protein [Eubacteriales bacterium]
MQETLKLSELSGVGKVRLQSLNNAGIYSLKDLLSTYPVKHQDTTKITPLCMLKEGNFVCVEGKIKASPNIQYAKGKLVIVRASLEDDTATVPIIFFNQPWMMNNLKKDSTFTFYGAVQSYRGKISLLNPEIVHRRGVVPKYQALDGIGSKTFENLIEQALPFIEKLFEDVLTQNIKQRYNLLSIQDAVYQMHRPESAQKLSAAKRRISFDDILYYQIAVLSIKGQKNTAPPIKVDKQTKESFENLLPFTLT